MCESVFSFPGSVRSSKTDYLKKTGYFSKESSLDCGFLIQGNHNLIGFLFVEGRNFIILDHEKRKKGREWGY